MDVVFEGVSLRLPAGGVKYAFKAGQLVLKFESFTGDVVLRPAGDAGAWSGGSWGRRFA